MSDLTQERLRSILRYDSATGMFTRIAQTTNAVKIGARAGSLGTDGYLRIWIDGRSYKAHRLAWLYVHGSWPTKQIDHRNGDPTDNRIDNLREATQSEQNANTRQRQDNTSGLRGVSFHKATGKYTARFSHGGKLLHVSYHATPELAAAAYDAASRQHIGEFRRT